MSWGSEILHGVLIYRFWWGGYTLKLKIAQLKESSIVEVRAMLEARINMLRKGRKFQNEAVLIDSLMINFS